MIGYLIIAALVLVAELAVICLQRHDLSVANETIATFAQRLEVRRAEHEATIANYTKVVDELQQLRAAHQRLRSKRGWGDDNVITLRSLRGPRERA